MINLKNFKILKYTYPFPTEDFEEKLWDKMTEIESKWAIKLNLSGINDSGGDDNTSWDIFFLEEKIKNKINEILIKYEIPFEIEDQTLFLKTNLEKFSEEFIKKINVYLKNQLTVDDVLDNILEIGYDNITIFEKYFLDNNIIINEKK